ncbi:MAG TPA: hypothetical protein VLH94_00005, partial [Spirochaetia bacterium]|nr:hypothetical protein [Spirochaetia bacterium]
VNISAGSTHFGVVIWDADKLSPECQSVLLKPLEESSAKTCLYLIVSNENGLLPTVLSRCVVMSYVGDHKLLKEYWKSVLECFSKGPAKCLSLADELEKSEMVIMLEEIIFKLKSGLGAEVNINRLKILKLAIDSLSVIRYSNVNPKMTLANFLINSWRLIKVPTR